VSAAVGGTRCEIGRQPHARRCAKVPGTGADRAGQDAYAAVRPRRRESGHRRPETWPRHRRRGAGAMITYQESAVSARLRELGIAYERHEHPAVPTVEAAEEHWAAIDATHCKNLFLRNQKGNRHYLVVL